MAEEEGRCATKTAAHGPAQQKGGGGAASPGPASALAAWEEAAQLLRQSVDDSASLEKLWGSASPATSQAPDGQAPEQPAGAPAPSTLLLEVVHAKRSLLLLQEELTWLAQVVATGLASKELHTSLLLTLYSDALSASEDGFEVATQAGALRGEELLTWLSSSARGSAEEAEKVQRLAQEGFELQGVWFRAIWDANEWRTVCAEIRRAQGDGALPGSRLIAAVEGLGIRLVAVPALPPDVAEGAQEAGDACIDWVRSYLQQRRCSVPKDLGALQRWCAGLPNPRDLLSLEAPLSLAAASAPGGSSLEQRVPCLALVFGAAPVEASILPAEEKDISVGQYARPTLLSAASEDALLGEVAEAFHCSRAALKFYSVGGKPAQASASCNVFGCMCKVCYRPPQTEARRNSSAWSWQSDSFAIILSGPVVLPAGGLRTSAALERQLGLAGSYLTSSVGFPQHPRAVRNALHAHGVPVRFAFALARPQACEHAEQEAGPGVYCSCSPLEEAVGAELVAASAKHVARAITRGAPLATAPPGGDGESLAKVAVGVVRTEVTGAEWHSSKKAVSKVAEIVVGTTVGEASVIEPEQPMPPMRPQRVSPDDDPGSPRGPNGSNAATPCSATLESEVQHLLTALELHPELERMTREMPGAEQFSVCRLAFLHVAFWVRLAVSARQLEALEALSGDSECGAFSPAELAQLGTRLLGAAWQAPPFLVRAISSQLGVELTAPVLRRLRPLNESTFATAPVRLPGSDAVAFPEISVVKAAYFKTKGSTTFEHTVADVLMMAQPCAHSPPAAAAAAASLLVSDDLSLHPCWQRCHQLGRSEQHRGLDCTTPRSAKAGPSAADPQSKQPASDAFAPATGADNLLVRPSLSSAIAAAILVSREAQDQRFPRHRMQRARDLLRFAQWLLLAVLHQAYCGASLLPVLSEHPEQSGAAQMTEAEESCLKTAISAVLHVLQAVLTILESLGTCPAELLVATWTLRAYAHEKQCQIDTCFSDYLQALSLIDEAWGDPRKRGGRGHPFALLLTWKLGLISYSRSDVKSIDKFADYFRSLALYQGCGSPFVWGPPIGSGTDSREKNRPKGRESSMGQRELGLLLRASEACMWAGGAFWEWWRQHDVLNFAADGLAVPGSAASSPTDEGSSARAESSRRRPLQAPEDSVTAELQEVRRGTIFAFGSNHLGQLGVGLPTMRPPSAGSSPPGGAGDAAAGPPRSGGALPSAPGSSSNGGSGGRSHATAGTCCPSRNCAGPDLWWSGRPVRIMALKECRMKDVACGEAHCVALDLEGRVFAWGSNEWCQAVHLPVTFQVPVRFAAVVCGAQFSVALDRGGCIWSWGAGEGGVLGLGVPGLDGRPQPTRLERFVSGTCIAVACGSFHSMAISGNGELFSWGRAEGGQLGIAEPQLTAHIELRGLDDTCVCEPLRVFFNGGEGGDAALDIAEGPEKPSDEVAGSGCEDTVRVRQVAGGDVHSLALDADGQVWSWGWGEFGQLGLGFSAASYSLGVGGASSKRLTPQKIKPEHFGSMAIKSVACGGAFSAAVGDVGQSSPGHGGNLFLWGANEVGQCAMTPKNPVEVVVPTKVKGLAQTVVRSIACGGAHAVAIDLAGRAYSWGSAQYGQLGSFSPPKTFRPPPAFDAREAEGGALARHQPTLIQSVSRLHIMKAACGLHHSLIISEVSGESVARRAGKSSKDSGRRAKGLSDIESAGESRSGAAGAAVAA